MRTIHPRSAWTSYAPAFTYMPPQRNWWLHHTAGGCSPVFFECLRATEEFHIRVRNMLAIAYLLAATQDGEAAQARGVNTVGGHTLDWNSRSHAIVVPGDFTYLEPTDELLGAIADIVVQSIDDGHALPDPIFGGHRDAGTTATACPGNKLYARIPDIRDLIAQGGSGAPLPPPIPKAATHSRRRRMATIYKKEHEDNGYPVHTFLVGGDGRLIEKFGGANGQQSRSVLPAGSCASGRDAEVDVADVPGSELFYVTARAAEAGQPSGKVHTLLHTGTTLVPVEGSPV